MDKRCHRRRYPAKIQKEMRYYAILLAIVPFVSLLTSHMSIQLTIWMFWLLAAIFLLSLPIMRANHRLKTWKTQNHLYEDRQPEHYVELKQAGSVRKVLFLPFSCQISSVLQVPCCCFQSPAGLGFPV